MEKSISSKIAYYAIHTECDVSLGWVEDSNWYTDAFYVMIELQNGERFASWKQENLSYLVWDEDGPYVKDREEEATAAMEEYLASLDLSEDGLEKTLSGGAFATMFPVYGSAAYQAEERMGLYA
tara:strand:+ start:7558 stop:7929 length:372 start_codon:yes stop_codon:yes gene_type:complete